MKIHLHLSNQCLTATLDDNPSARDFAELLPLTLTLEDYAATEKISDLPRRLDTTGAPAGHTAQADDLTYYAPWGNLAIFHKPFSHASGLVFLGQLDEGVEHMREPGRLKVTLTRAD